MAALYWPVKVLNTRLTIKKLVTLAAMRVSLGWLRLLFCTAMGAAFGYERIGDCVLLYFIIYLRVQSGSRMLVSTYRSSIC